MHDLCRELGLPFQVDIASGAGIVRTLSILAAEMTPEEFKKSLSQEAPPHELSAPLVALWWDAKGDWARGHDLINDLETKDAMAVHAYLHRKEGEAWNADYWYRRAGRSFHRPTLEAEWQALLEGLLRDEKS